MNYLKKTGLSLSTTKKCGSMQLKNLKVFSGLSPEIIKGIFECRNEKPYNLTQRSQFHIPLVHTVVNGTESIKFVDPKTQELVPDVIKQ